MSSLLLRSKEETVVVAPSATVPVTKAIVTNAIAEQQETIQETQLGKVQRVQNPRQRSPRTLYIALSMLGVTAVLLIRWYIANQTPVYPKGEAAYPATTASKVQGIGKPNSGIFYKAALSAYPMNMPELVTYGGAYGLSDAPLAVQKSAIAQAQPALTLLRQGMQYSYLPDQATEYYSDFSRTGSHGNRPNFIPMREIARMLAAEAHCKGLAGDTAGALSSSLDAIRFGIDIGQGNSVRQGMMGVLIEGLGIEEASKHIDKLSAPEARAAAVRLERMLPEERTFAQTMTSERDAVYELVKETFANGSKNRIAASMLGMNRTSVAGKLEYEAAIFYYSKQGIVNAYASQMDEIIARGKMPYQQAKTRENIGRSRSPLAYNMVPDCNRTLEVCARTKVRNQVLLAQLAIHAYREEHGGLLPSSLQALTEGKKTYLAALPTDAFSATGIEPLRYDPEDGMVYSVGQNGIDESYSGDDSLAD